MLQWVKSAHFHVFVFFAVFLCQVMVTNVTSLLKTVKAVEDEATRGTRALEATIECIKQELSVRTGGCWPAIVQHQYHQGLHQTGWRIIFYMCDHKNSKPWRYVVLSAASRQMTTPHTHFVASRCFNPRMLPTRQPHPRSSSAWLRASPLQLLRRWLQGTLPGRRTSSIRPTSAEKLSPTCSPPARFLFFSLTNRNMNLFFIHITEKKASCWIWSGCVSVLQQAAYHPEVSEEVKNRALMFGSECTTGYIDLLEHVLLVG